MSASTKEQTAPRRRNRVYGSSEISGARSSTLSVTSNVTGTSTCSGGSASTVTQDSYRRSRQSGERKKKTKRRSDSDRKMEKATGEIEHGMRDVDVFEFLVEEDVPEDISEEIKVNSPTMEPQNVIKEVPEVIHLEVSEVDPVGLEIIKLPAKNQALAESDGDESESESEEDSEEEEPSVISNQKQEMVVLREPQSEPEMQESKSIARYKQEEVKQHEHSSLEAFYRNQLSDSGISMGSSVSEPHLDPFMKHPPPPVIEEAVDQPVYGDYPVYVPTMIDPYYPHDQHQVWGPFGNTAYNPEPLPLPLSPGSIRNYPYPQEYAYRGTPDPPSTGELSVACLDSAPLVFRDKSNRSTPPPKLFRTFAKVNARVLLQMQSNIADLEHELAVLDMKASHGDHMTRSKKGEHNSGAKQSTKDQSYRTDLYQELHTSLEQYYETLSSFHQISQITAPSTTEDRSSLKSWLQTHVTPSSRVSPLMGDGSDLVRLGRPLNETSDQSLRLIAYSVFTNVFVPLLLFKLAAGVLSRLILLSLTTTVATLAMDRHRINTKVELGNLYWHCILGCVGISLIAALLF